MDKAILEVDSAVNAKVKEMINSGAVAKLIESKVEETITEAIETELRSYSDFGKRLKEYINKSLQVNFDELGFEGYNENLLRVISKVYQNSMESVHLDKVKKLTEEMLANPPEVVKLSELIDAVKEKAREHVKDTDKDDHYETYVHEGEITCIIEDRHDSYFTYIHLDPEEHKSRHDCAYRIGLSKRPHLDNEIEIFSLNIRGEDSGNLFVQETYGLERLLFKAKCASSAFEFDVEEPDTSYEVEIEPECHC